MARFAYALPCGSASGVTEFAGIVKGDCENSWGEQRPMLSVWGQTFSWQRRMKGASIPFPSYNVSSQGGSAGVQTAELRHQT